MGKWLLVLACVGCGQAAVGSDDGGAAGDLAMSDLAAGDRAVADLPPAMDLPVADLPPAMDLPVGDLSVGDSSVADSAVGDSSVADSAVGDSAVGDSSVGDAAMAKDGATPVDLAASDLKAPGDLASMPDLATSDAGKMCAMQKLPGTCKQLADWTTAWIDCNLGCSSDQDCTTVSVHEGTFCKNACPVVSGTKAIGGYLTQLTNDFEKMNCGMAGCACLMVQPPHCVNGTCM